jgi:hypothetical protein
VLCDGLGAGARERRVLRPICDRAAIDLDRQEREITRLAYRTGFTRNVLYAYQPSITSPGINPQVKLEMGIRGGTLPGTVKRTVRSYIAEHVERAHVRADFDELAPIEVEVIAPVRTLAEKLALLHHAGVEAVGGAPRSLEAAGRHIYDVFRLLSDTEVIAALAIDGSRMTNLAPDVDAKSAEYGWEFTARPEGGYSTSTVFDPSGSVRAIAERGYVDAQGLMWGTIPTFEECLALLADRGHLL